MKALITLLFLSTIAYSQTKLSYLVQLDENYTKNVLVVEKSTHKMFIYTARGKDFVLDKTFNIASGKSSGNKMHSGDRKTPEGIYALKEFYSKDHLVSKYGKPALIYGAGAFTLDYPSYFDKLNNKTGHGIWLHSTDDDARVSKGLDSKGCVVATDKDIKKISKYINLKRTPIIIAENLTFLKEDTFRVNKNKLELLFNNWIESWKNKSINKYISYYSTKEFKDPKKGNLNSYKKYKSYIFKKSESPQIDFSDTTILRFKDTAIISATQNYKSKHIKDIGRKTLYLKLDHKYEWKIVKEHWQSMKENTPTVFFEDEIKQ